MGTLFTLDQADGTRFRFESAELSNPKLRLWQFLSRDGPKFRKPAVAKAQLASIVSHCSKLVLKNRGEMRIMAELAFLFQVAATLSMVGFIWLVQVERYPPLGQVGRGEFSAFVCDPTL